MSAVMPWYIAQSPWALDFDKFFPEANGQWDHPTVKDALRKQALMITMKCMKGKEVKPQTQRMAEFVLTKFVGQEGIPQQHIHITLDQILELKRKAGLKPELKTITQGRLNDKLTTTTLKAPEVKEETKSPVVDEKTSVVS